MGAFSAKSLNFLKALAKEGAVEVKQLHSNTPKAEIASLPVGTIFLFKYVLIEVKVTSKGGYVYWITGRRDSKHYKNSPRRVRHLEVLGMLVEPITLTSPLGNTLFSCVKLSSDQITQLSDLETLYNIGTRQKDTYRTYRLGSMYNILQISGDSLKKEKEKEQAAQDELNAKKNE